jgi:hypothetical protein
MAEEAATAGEVTAEDMDTDPFQLIPFPYWVYCRWVH